MGRLALIGVAVIGTLGASSVALSLGPEVGDQLASLALLASCTGDDQCGGDWCQPVSLTQPDAGYACCAQGGQSCGATSCCGVTTFSCHSGICCQNGDQQLLRGRL